MFLPRIMKLLSLSKWTSGQCSQTHTMQTAPRGDETKYLDIRWDCALPLIQGCQKTILGANIQAKSKCLWSEYVPIKMSSAVTQKRMLYIAKNTTASRRLSSSNKNGRGVDINKRKCLCREKNVEILINDWQDRWNHTSKTTSYQMVISTK